MIHISAKMFSAFFLTFLLAATLITIPVFAEEEKLPSTGREIAAMQGIDRVVLDLMEKWKIPGGAVAISCQGRLVHARGFGWADREKQLPVEPDSLFRIASISKPLTSVMLLILADEGKLDLDEPAIKYLEDDYQPFDDKPIDPKLKKVTIRQLLQHTGGFDRGASFGPMFQPKELFKRLGRPAESGEIIRFMLSRPLDYTPGEKYIYSNFGYCMLGRVIEKVTGKSYATAVQERVLRPTGAHRTQIGKTDRTGRVDGEVIYYGRPSKSIFAKPDNEPAERETSPYCSFYIESMDSSGGWISSTIDLLRFANSADGRRSPALLKPETAKLMLDDTLKKPDGTRSAYALGWAVSGKEKCSTWQHSGSLPGTSTFLVTTEDGRSCAVLFNRRASSGKFFGDLTREIMHALRQIETWPEGDRFGELR